MSNHKCSCGRTFDTRAALERHTWVTRHEPAVVEPVVDPSREAVLAALRVLKQKQASQRQFDRKEQNLLQACTVMHRQFRRATQRAASGETVSSDTLLRCIRMLAMLLMIGGLAVTGLNIVNGL